MFMKNQLNFLVSLIKLYIKQYHKKLNSNLYE